MKTQYNQGLSWLEVLVILTITLVFIPLAIPPSRCGVTESSRIVEASNNCRQIIMFCKQYAADHEGKYPDSDKATQPRTANEVFRLLVKEGFVGSVEDGKVFESPVSPYKSDRNLGVAPDFKEACAPGEVHWVMTKGLTDYSVSDAPFIFENAVVNSWPPAWNADAAGKQVQGRAWRRGRIIIGRNDGSVRTEQLESAKGEAVELKKDAEGKDLFTRYKEEGEFLDIQRE